MDIRVLDLDGSITAQEELLQHFDPVCHDLTAWGPRLRLATSFASFRRFARRLEELWPAPDNVRPTVTLYGSGDFHHVTLALVSRLRQPFHLVVIDNHPDWMGGVPLLHCGTWLWHAARLSEVRQIVHIGGDVDFDNFYRWLAPARLLHQGKIVVVPAARLFRGGCWNDLLHEPLRHDPLTSAEPDRIDSVLRPFAEPLRRHPLYISLDKDVLRAGQAEVNWDTGRLQLEEVQQVLRTLFELSHGNIIGMDIVGDWSPVRLCGLGRRLLHWLEHPRQPVDPQRALQSNERTNLAILEEFFSSLTKGAEPRREKLPLSGW